MKDLDKALSDIADIRGQLVAGAVFQGFGPGVIAATGVFAIALAGLQTLWPEQFAPSEHSIIVMWIATAFLAATLIGIEMFARSRRHHGGMADAMLVNAIELFLPAGFAGAAIGGVMIKFSPDNLWLLPGLWQVLVALGLFSAAKSLPKQISLVGAWYFLAGIGTLIITSLSEALNPWMMGAPFAIGQFLMAAILYFASEETHARR